jgi:membrane fusion protein, multidrug efflux system
VLDRVDAGQATMIEAGDSMQRLFRKKVVLTVVVLATVSVVMLVWRDGSPSAKPSAGKAGQAMSAVPVHAAAAMQGDVDLSLQVIGRAEAYSTVSVRSRVDGQLESLSFVPGKHVRKGEVIARIDPRLLKATLDQARGNVARDQAQLIKANADFARYASMLDKGYVSKADYDTYKANVAVAEAALQSDRAAQELARTQLDYTQIVAPFDGVAGAPLVYPGAVVSADTTDIVVLNEIEPIRVTFSLPEDSLPAVRAARARGEVAVQVHLTGDSGAPLKGVLEFIDNAVDTTTGTILLKGRFDNADDRLTPGQFVQVSLPTARIAQAVSIPVVALQNSSAGSFVFVIRPDGTVEQRPVTVGPNIADRVVIDKGLKNGESVVTDGQLQLVAGTHVRVSNL